MRIHGTSVLSQVGFKIGITWYLLSTISSYVQRLSTLTELGRKRQYQGKDHDLYVKRVHEKILDCSDPIDEEFLVNVFLHDMDNEYRVFLENI